MCRKKKQRRRGHSKSEANTSWFHFGPNTFFSIYRLQYSTTGNPLMENFIHLSFTCYFAPPVLTDAAHIHRTLSTVLVPKAGTTNGTESIGGSWWFPSIVLRLLGLIRVAAETDAQHQTQGEEHWNIEYTTESSEADSNLVLKDWSIGICTRLHFEPS